MVCLFQNMFDQKVAHLNADDVHNWKQWSDR